MSDDRLFSDVPVLPQPAYAGFPSPGDDYADPPLNVHDLVVAHPLATYFILIAHDQEFLVDSSRMDRTFPIQVEEEALNQAEETG